MLLLHAAHAMPLVVWNPDQVPEVQQALDDYWPGAGLEIELGPVAEVPRFELTFDALFWITPDGVVQRPVESADTAVLLARSWVVSGPPEDLGWVPRIQDPVPGAPAPVPPNEPRRALLDDLWFGFGVRTGWPDLSAIRGLGPVVGARRSVLLAQVQASSKTHSLNLNEVASFQQRGDLEVYDSRYGVALHVGLTSGGRHIARAVFAETFTFVGTEAQQYVRFDLAESIEADLPAWDFGLQVGGGAALRVQRAGLRSQVLLDLRDRVEPWQRSVCWTTAVVFHL
ncbi:MAG: hypothetical protein R3F61_24165 [Myxococcota bacterium]